jgi:hypothetical protein
VSSYERAKRWRDAKDERETAAARRLIEHGVPLEDPLIRVLAEQVRRTKEKLVWDIFNDAGHANVPSLWLEE